MGDAAYSLTLHHQALFEFVQAAQSVEAYEDANSIKQGPDTLVAAPVPLATHATPNRCGILAFPSYCEPAAPQVVPAIASKEAATFSKSAREAHRIYAYREEEATESARERGPARDRLNVAKGKRSEGDHEFAAGFTWIDHQCRAVEAEANEHVKALQFIERCADAHWRPNAHGGVRAPKLNDVGHMRLPEKAVPNSRCMGTVSPCC